MLPVTARITAKLPSQLDGQRAPAPTQEDFEAFCERLQKRDDAAALEQLARQPKLVTLTGKSNWIERCETALHRAAASGCSSPVIEALLHAGANLEATNNDGDTALLLAARDGHREAIDALLRAGANIEARASRGDTALIRAADKGHRDTIDALLHAGANIEATNDSGSTALIRAAINSHRDTIDTLLCAGANIEATNKYGDTALICVATNGHRDAIDTLLRAGANIEAMGNNGWTALMYAARWNHREAIDALLRAGANPNATDENDDTPLIRAAASGYREAIDALQLAYAMRGLTLSYKEQLALEDLKIKPPTPAQIQAAMADQYPKLIAAHAARQTRYTALTGELTTTQQQLTNTQTQLETAQAKNRLLEAEVVQSHSTAAQLTTDNHALEQELSDTRSRLTASTTQATERGTTWQQQAAQWHTEQASLGQRLEQTAQDYQMLLARHTGLEQEQANLQAQNNDWQQRHADLQSRLQRLEADKSQLRGTADQLATDKHTLAQQLETLQTQHIEQAQRIDQGETARKTLQATYDQAIEEQTTRQAEWQGTVSTLTAERDHAAQTHRQLQLRHQQLAQEAAEQAQQHQLRDAQHATDLQHKTRELAEAQTRNHAQAAENISLRAEIAPLTQRDQAREAELIAARTEIGTLLASNTTLEQQAKQTLTERDTLHQDHDRLQSRHEEQTKTLADTHARLTETLTRMQALETENAQLRGTAAQLATDKHSLEQRLADLQALRTDQETRITQGEACVLALKQQVADTEHRVVAKATELAEVASQLAAHRDQSSRAYQDLLARQVRLEQEKADLVHQQETLTHQHEDLQVRIDLLQAERQRLIDKVPQADTLPETQRRLQRERGELDTDKQRVAAQVPSRSREHELKLLAEREQRLREETERVDKQLRLFEAFGTTSRERVFTQFLQDVKRHADLQHARPQVFISYAWEDTRTPEGKARNETLQEKLLYLQRHIEALGCVVKLDLSDIYGNLNAYMASELEASRYVVLIGTPRLPQRIAEVPTPPRTKTPAAFEFDLMMKKVKDHPDCLIPLMLEGDYGTAFPDGVTAHLVRDFRGATATWPRQMAQLAAPGQNAGLISQLLSLTGAQRQTAGYAAYERLAEHFQLALEKAEREDSAKARNYLV